jgi:hypothetical protein
VIALAFGGELLLALIGANKAMVKTFAGKENAEEKEEPKNIKPGESFDPTLANIFDLTLANMLRTLVLVLDQTFPLPP